MTITLTEEIACARRELAMRKSAYPRWTASGKMTAQKAAHETACMEAIVRRLETIEAAERLI